MRNKFIYFLYIVTSISSCDNTKTCLPVHSTISSVSPFDSIHYRQQRIIEKSIGLSDISKGYDSFALRINLQYGMLKKEKLVSITYHNGVYTGKIFGMSVDQTAEWVPIVESWFSKEVTPISGWKQFMDSITAMGILSIRTQFEIPNWGVGVHNLGWGVEYATCDSFRSYSHYSFLGNVKEIEEAARILKIIQYVETELETELLSREYIELEKGED